MELSSNQKTAFTETLTSYYADHARHDLPWRISDEDGHFDPYKVLVSELMLQQTQVSRVVAKYEQFLQQFPTVLSLSQAELGDVLRAWQGLGYNRRAKYLWLAAQQIVQDGAFPRDVNSLVALPGVGENTAGAVLAYAFNSPAIFVETNIRTVILHHFTRDGQIVSDSFVRDCLGQVLDRSNPRVFYWAMMDYGSYLKTQVKNNAQSKHYTKQSTFAGSNRQLRGAIIRALSDSAQDFEELSRQLDDPRLSDTLAQLVKEGLVQQKDREYYL